MVTVTTATGISETTLHDDAHIYLMGREVTTQVLALPAGSAPLLGVIPMEQLGIEPDLERQQVRVLPRHTSATHFRI